MSDPRLRYKEMYSGQFKAALKTAGFKVSGAEMQALVARYVLPGDDPGSSEYSAVTQPSPLPLIHRGTSSSTDAVHSTRVSPNVTRHDPIVMVVKSRVNENGRSSSGARPS